MTTTNANGIVFLEETDPISPFHTLMNTLQQGTSDALDAIKYRPDPGTAIRGTDSTLGINAWQNLSGVLTYTFRANHWYLLMGRGQYQIGGAPATVLTRLFASGLSVSPELGASVTHNTSHRADDFFIFKSNSTATVNVSHQVYANAPSTGVICVTNSTVSVIEIL